MTREEKLACPRCGTRMDEGFLLERGDSDSASTTRWVEGRPEKSRWTGLKLKDRLVIPLRSFRCIGCGYVESYARPPD